MTFIQEGDTLIIQMNDPIEGDGEDTISWGLILGIAIPLVIIFIVFGVAIYYLGKMIEQKRQ